MSSYFVNSSSINPKTKMPTMSSKCKTISGKTLRNNVKKVSNQVNKKMEKKKQTQQNSVAISKEVNSSDEVMKETMQIKVVMLKPDMSPSHEEQVKFEEFDQNLDEMSNIYDDALQYLTRSIQAFQKVSMVLTISHSKLALDQTLHNLTVAILGDIDFTHNTIHFRYYMFDGTKIVNLLDLSSEVTSHIKPRHVSSAEHVSDLIKLGNFGLDRTQAVSAVTVAQFDVKYSNGDVRQIYLMVALWQSLLQSGSFAALDKCIEARQRAQSLIPFNTHPLTHQLQTLFEEPSILSIFYAPDKLSEETLVVLKQLRQLKQYGTDDDIFGDKIIQKNQTLIENLKGGASEKHDETAVYLYLLNNVSILENELLDSHQHYSKVMQNWSHDHSLLEKINSDTQLYDVDQYTDRMIQLLLEQRDRITHLIELANMFKLGLKQLKQSVDMQQQQ